MPDPMAGGSPGTAVAQTPQPSSGEDRPAELTRPAYIEETQAVEAGSFAGADDQAKIQAAISYVKARWNGGRVNIGPRVWDCPRPISLPSYVELVGAGRDATILKKSFTGNLIEHYGTASVSGHVTYSSVRDLTLWGSGSIYPGSLIDVVYADNLELRNLFLRGNDGPGLNLTELWDSLIDNIVCDACNSATEPAIWIRSSRAAAGFGNSVDNSNVIRLLNSRCESWKAGALVIEQGTGAVQSSNHIWVENFKAESYFLRGPAIRVTGANIVDLRTIYVFMGGFDSGFATAQRGIDLDIGIEGSIRDSQIGNDGAATISDGLYIWCGTPLVVENVVGVYSPAPASGNHVNLAGGGPYALGWCQSAGATRNVSLGAGVTLQGRGPIATRTGDIDDADFTGAAPSGTIAVSTDQRELYVRVGAATWRAVPLGQLGAVVVASGANIDPGDATFVDVSGTTNITSMTAKRAGRVVTLKFQGILTFTDGGNLRLNGNFVTSADDTITLVSDGTNWYEIARSAN